MLKNKLKFFSFLLILLFILALGVSVFNFESKKFSAEVQSAHAATSSPFNPNIFVDLAKKVVPGVVNISIFTRVRAYAPYDDQMRDFYEKFFGPQFGGRGGMPPQPRGRNSQKQEEALLQPSSLGSGFVIDTSGLILTNNHVVQNADEIKVYFTEDAGEKPLNGEVVGRDAELDLALIKVKPVHKLTALPFGDSDSLQVGEFVIAVGNPFGQGHSVTQGIISAKNRDIPNFVLGRYIQTDAPINPGNSGGPLVNLNGEVIGINNAIDARAQGIGFAIPANLVKKVLPQLKSEGYVKRGYIGVLVDELTPELAQQIGVPKDTKGVFVSHANPGDPASKAGVKAYDIITEFNGTLVRTQVDLVRAVTSLNVGETASVKIIRDGKPKTLSIKVTERPSDEVATSGNSQKREGGSTKPKGDFEKQSGLSLTELNEKHIRELRLPKGVKGVVVAGVNGGNSPAAEAGISRGDLIVEVNRKEIRSVSELKQLLKSGKSYLLKVIRMKHARQRDGSIISEPQYLVIILDLRE